MSYGSRSGLDYQRLVGRWVEMTFGKASLLDLRNRTARVAEEGLELAQSEGVTREEALRILERVYSRPAGEPKQEAAGVVITAFAFAQAKGFGLLGAVGRELTRLERTDPAVFRAKQREKFAAGTDFATPLP